MDILYSYNTRQLFKLDDYSVVLFRVPHKTDAFISFPYLLFYDNSLILRKIEKVDIGLVVKIENDTIYATKTDSFSLFQKAENKIFKKYYLKTVEDPYKKYIEISDTVKDIEYDRNNNKLIFVLMKNNQVKTEIYSLESLSIYRLFSGKGETELFIGDISNKSKYSYICDCDSLLKSFFEKYIEINMSKY
jgi:hypothetical protein